jgi:peptide/nickel transport system substrate-binding protein
LNYAVDRTQIVSGALKGRGIAATGVAWPQHWAFDATVPSFTYDPLRSTALLDAAGVPKVVSTHSNAPPSRLDFTCLIPEGFALWEHIGLMVQRDLAQIGVDMTLENVPFETFNRRIATGAFDAVLMEFVVGSSPSRPFTFWYSKSKRNVWGYVNQNMDQALDHVRRASSEGEYRNAFKEFQAQGLADPPAIFLALGENTRAVSRRFQVVAQPGSDILPTIADWLPASSPSRVSN